MLRKVIGLILLGCSSYLAAQTTVISATVVDTDGTTWANGSWSITFNPNPSQPNPNIYNINGTPLSPSVTMQSGSLDGSGAFSATIYNSTLISPSDSGWTLNICPNASTSCGVYKFSSAGSTMNLSSNLTSIIPPPRFHPVSGTYGYNDNEAVVQLLSGSTYFDVTTLCQKVYSGITWGCISALPNTLTGTLTSGTYPIASGAHTLANSTITNLMFDYGVSLSDTLSLNGTKTGSTGLHLASSGDSTWAAGTAFSLHILNGSFTVQADGGNAAIQAHNLSLNSGDPTIQFTQFMHCGGSAVSPITNYIGDEAPSSCTAYNTIRPSSPPPDPADFYTCSNTIPSVCTWTQAPLQGVTNVIGGSPLSASCASGTALVAGSLVSQVAVASPANGVDPGPFTWSARIPSNGTVEVKVCGTGTPTSTTYVVRVLP